MKPMQKGDDIAVDATHSAFLVVYAVFGKLREENFAASRVGIDTSYLVFKTSVGEVRLPSSGRPHVLVRLAKNQILVNWETYLSRDEMREINDLIFRSFEGINAHKKRGFREAFRNFKQLSN